jgi:Cdc6-like AAA superfamily ATPase
MKHSINVPVVVLEEINRLVEKNGPLGHILSSLSRGSRTLPANFDSYGEKY